MVCARATDYNEAIQNLRSSVSDEELREGRAAVNACGVPYPYSGNFADVYKVHCAQTDNTWAVKCFTKELPGLRERYREISAHLQRFHLPFMVDFVYVEPGIRIGKDWHPFLKMRWVDGVNLNQFLSERLDRPGTLKQLLDAWIKLCVQLRKAHIAHADLQHGNVLLVPAADQRLKLKLIDYDGMFVPGLAGQRTGELGHPSYQHPQRIRDRIYSAEVDRFSHLAIFSAIYCLMVRPEELWKRFDNGDNLLFRETDFQTPESSDLFHLLWSLDDPQAHSLAGRLILSSRLPLDQVPWLDEVVTEGKVRPLSRDEEHGVSDILGGRMGQVGRQSFAGFDPAGPRQTPPVSAEAAPDAPASRRRDQAAESLRDSRSDSERRDQVVGTPAWSPVRSQFAGPLAVAPFSEHKARKLQCAWADGMGLPWDPVNSIGMKLVLVPPGEFIMGAAGREKAEPAEKPQHRVRITRPFYLGARPVTLVEYHRVMGEIPGDYRVLEDAAPVENISWDHAIRFCRKLSCMPGEKAAGRTYRLPTEAEWEYACRAGTTTAWCSGDAENDLEEYAWFRGNSGDKRHVVGEKRPNGFGLFDMHGNVWEWCADWYDERYYANSLRQDPCGPASGTHRVVRGGSWFDPAIQLRSAFRKDLRPDYEFGLTGVRVAVDCVVGTL